MPKKSPVRPCYVAAFALSLVFSSPAHAGFEWVSPNDTAAPQQAPVTIGGAPQASAMPEIISPVVITGSTKSPSPQPSYAPASTYQAPAVTAPMPISVTPPAPAATTYLSPRPNLATATIVAPASGGDLVQGFASQIPLPLALRQILPAGMNFSIDQDIDMDTPVSYKGGKPWRDTLRDMLASAGLVDHEQGGVVTISHMAAASAAPGPSSVAPMMPAAPLAPLPEKSIGSLTLVSEAPAAPMHTDMAAINVGTPDGWSVERGDTLRKALTAWCQRAGVELQWIAEYDYPVEASAHFNGGFEDAVRGLLAGFDGARPQPVGQLHTNANAGQMVLVVQARGNNYSN
jgi:hypothetical protein